MSIKQYGKTGKNNEINKMHMLLFYDMKSYKHNSMLI